MEKYIIKNCPALRYDVKKYKICHDRNAKTKCEDINDCIIKQIYSIAKDFECDCPTFYNCVCTSCEQLDLIVDKFQIEEVKCQ